MLQHAYLKSGRFRVCVWTTPRHTRDLYWYSQLLLLLPSLFKSKRKGEVKLIAKHSWIDSDNGRAIKGFFCLMLIKLIYLGGGAVRSIKLDDALWVFEFI